MAIPLNSIFFVVKQYQVEYLLINVILLVSIGI